MSSPSPNPGNAAPNSTILNNRYRLLTTVAAGGMATVFKGQDTLLNRLVAIKILRDRYASDPQFVQRFREESQAAANLNHPNIVAIYDVGRDVIGGQERHYIVMELVEGQDLKQAMRSRAISGHQFTIEEAVDIARQICEGVAYAHRRGLAHCDLKPQNVVLALDGRVKVTDFGIARAYTAMLSTDERANVVWGTPQYYAPEQAMGNAPTPASDVYSISVMLYEMLTGRLPFEARDAQSLAQMHLTAQPQPPHVLNPNVTPQLESIVMRALAKDPLQRYRDADQFARALAAYAMQGEEQTMVNMRPAAPRPTTPAPQPVRQPPMVKQPAPQPARRPAPAQVIVTTPTSTQDMREQAGPDPLLWLLAAIAFLCVLGLIPLYYFVYQAYQSPSPAPAPTVAPINSGSGNAVPISITNGNAQIKVPNLIGMPVEQAARELAVLGLNMSVAEERPSSTYTQTIVLEQRTPPDALVNPGSLIEVVVSKGAELRDVPNDLVGRSLDEAVSQSLTSLGWNVVMTEALDFAPAGTILASQPPAGSKLAMSDTLTVTVSSGGRIDLNVDMPPVVLESVTLPRNSFVPGQTVQFRVKWRATRPVGQDYNVGWYLFTLDNGAVLAQGEDRAPRNNGLPAPTSAWTGGMIIEDTYALRIPDNIAPGSYPIEIGMYAGQERLRVANPGNTTAPNNLVVLHIIEVQ